MRQLSFVAFVTDLAVALALFKPSVVFDNLSIFSYIFLLLLLYYSFRVYELSNLLKVKEQLLRTFTATLLNALFFGLLDLFSLFDLSLKLILTTVLLSLLASFANVIISNLLKRFFKTKRYVLIGKEDEYSHLVKSLSNGEYIPVEIAGYVNPSLSKLDSLLQSCNGVLIGNLEFANRIEKFLQNYDEKEIFYLPQFIETHLKRIPLDLVERYQQYYILEFSKPKDKIATRILDLIVGSFLLIVTLPLWGIIAMAILIEDGRPVIFKQKRAGKDGKLFTMYKFRSMRNIPENDSQPKYPDEEKDRILKIGKLIRKFRLDELPQLINVLKGDMSIVGPRPEQKELHERYSNAQIPCYEYRLKVKPGITGWAQITYRYSSSVEEAAKKLEYDLWYVKNKSFWLDLKIILKTPETMLFRRGVK